MGEKEGKADKDDTRSKSNKERQGANMAADGRGPETLWNGEQRNSLENDAEQLKTYFKLTAGVTLQPLLWAACGSFQAADTLPLTSLLGTVLQCSKAHQL